MFERLGLIGCGLMGGSFALAAKRAALVERVVGYSKSTATLRLAQDVGAIDDVAATAADAASQADLVLLAIPVASTETIFKAIRPALAPDALILDVGSTKRNVVDAARRTLRDNAANFVPCHPITGREVSGVKNADARLYAGKQVILTPIDRTRPARVDQARALWQALGCKVTQMTPESHDAALAAVSHLPHLIAFALINAIVAQSEGATYLSLAGPGFRDFSRIAASDPQMWRDVLLANREELGAQLGHFRTALDDIQRLIDSGQSSALYDSIYHASQVRATWRAAAKTP